MRNGLIAERFGWNWCRLARPLCAAIDWACVRRCYLRRALVLLIAVLACGVCPAEQGIAADRPQLLAANEFSIPWLMSEDVRVLEEEIDFLQLRLNSLAPYSALAIEQAGYHSRPAGVASRNR